MSVAEAQSPSTRRAVVVGAAGYTGAEVLRLLARHPRLHPVACFGSASRSGDASLADEHPRFHGTLDLPVLPASIDAIAQARPDVIFLATPHEASASLARDLLTLDGSPRVVDLSGAFRLPDAADYPKHYGFEHPAQDLLPGGASPHAAVYALVEANRDRLDRETRLVAVPGCYPTATGLPLRPLVDAGLVKPGSTIVVTAISGVSGAGRGLNRSSLFCEVGVGPYKVLAHRHEPEIRAHALHAGVTQAGSAEADAIRNESRNEGNLDLVFTPHLAPLDRGLVSTINLELASGSDEADVRAALTHAYANEPFVRLLPPGRQPRTLDVVRTNRCDIGCTVDASRGRAVRVGAIDNLVKGAAGQAVQSLNVCEGWDETLGLEVL